MIDIENKKVDATYEKVEGVRDYNNIFYDKNEGDRVIFYYKTHWRETFQSKHKKGRYNEIFIK